MKVFSLTIETLEMSGLILLTQLRMFLHFHQTKNKIMYGFEMKKM